MTTKLGPSPRSNTKGDKRPFTYDKLNFEATLLSSRCKICPNHCMVCSSQDKRHFQFLQNSKLSEF